MARTDGQSTQDFLRMVRPADLWDRTLSREVRASILAEDPDWSLFRLSQEVTVERVVGAYFGWRPQKEMPPDVARYVLFSEEELLSTGGSLLATPAGFAQQWPLQVEGAHRSLRGHEKGALALIERLDQLPVQEVPRVQLLLWQWRLSFENGAMDDFKKRPKRRIKILKETDPSTFEEFKRLAREAGRPYE